MKIKKGAMIAYAFLFVATSVAVAGTFGAASARASDAFVSLDTFSGSPGSMVNVSGGDFVPGETVDIFLGSISNSPTATTTAASSSLFGPVAVEIPQSATQGPLIIAAVGASSSLTANNSYYVEPLFPGITVTSTANTPESIIDVGGSGFASNEAVRISLGSATDTVSADASGSFMSFPFTIPFLAPSTYPLTAIGVGSHASVTNEFYVGGFYPSVTPSIYFVMPGNEVSFSGSGFAPNEPVNVFEDANQSSSLSVSANASGSFQSAGPVTIPFGLISTSTTFTFIGASSSASTSQAISLGSLTPSLVPSTYFLNRGNSFTVSASGFASREQINFAVYGNALESVSADASGTASAGPFTVPLSASSTLLIKATGNSSGAMASTSITIGDLVPQQFASSTLNVSLIVNNTAGGTATSSDFTVIVSGANADPATFVGSVSSTSVMINGDTDFTVTATSSMQNYVLTSSGNCAGQIASTLSDACAIAETYRVSPASIVIQPLSLSDATLSAAYSATIIASTTATDTFAWNISSGALPPGISLDASSTASTTTISGTPTTAGTFHFTIAAASGSSTVNQAYAFTVDQPAGPVSTGGGGTVDVSSGGGGGGTVDVSSGGGGGGTVDVSSDGGGGGFNNPTNEGGTTTATLTKNPGLVLGASTTSVNVLAAQLLLLEQKLVADQFAAASCKANFNENLRVGMRGVHVQILQEALNDSGMTQVAVTGPGSPGNESTYFGPKTLKAVIAFQDIFAQQILQPNGLTSGNGFVGRSTQSELNALCSVSAQTNTIK